jgi:hypothetical protein
MSLKKPATARHLALDANEFEFIAGEVEHPPQSMDYSIECPENVAFAPSQG